MGCKEVNDPTANLPTLICTVEPKNEAQKQYCIKLKDNFNYPTSVKYEISAYAGSTFNILLVIQGKNHSIQTTLNESDENEVKNNLQKIYDILNSYTNPMPNIAQSTIPEANPNLLLNSDPNALNTNLAPINMPNNDPNAMVVNNVNLN